MTIAMSFDTIQKKIATQGQITSKNVSKPFAFLLFQFFNTKMCSAWKAT